jgi:hypothetical protein
VSALDPCPALTRSGPRATWPSRPPGEPPPYPQPGRSAARRGLRRGTPRKEVPIPHHRGLDEIHQAGRDLAVRFFVRVAHKQPNVPHR